MKDQLLELLCCPECKKDLMLIGASESHGEIENGHLKCSSCSKLYPVVRSIPRFVSAENYASNFGFQWKRFRKTQLDSYSGLPISRNRFFNQTGLAPENLNGKLVLDIGCGSGRFSEIALSSGARVVALDYSSAVDACADNLLKYPSLNMVQADIYELPFKPGLFDLVYCFGVLQHTPDVENAFKALSIHVTPGGLLAVDVYPDLWQNFLWPKYWLRSLTKGLPQKTLFYLVTVMVKYLLPISLAIGKIPKVGHKLRFAIPVSNYDGVFPLSKSQLKEWAILDTFDMLAPAYDYPQTEERLRSWFKDVGMKEIEVLRLGVFVGRGIKPK